MDLKTRYVYNKYKMNYSTISNNNHFISKYGKTLHQLTWFSLPPAEDPLNIMENIKETKIVEKPKEKPPTFIPTDIMSNILSYLPKPVIKPQEYGIMNNKKNDGCFMMITKITPKFVVYDRCKWYENGMIFPLEQNCRSKLRKDKTRRYYYIFYRNDEYIIDNKLPLLKYNMTLHQFKWCSMTIEQYKKLLNDEFFNKTKYNYYCEDDTLPINIEV